MWAKIKCLVLSDSWNQFCILLFFHFGHRWTIIVSIRKTYYQLQLINVLCPPKDLNRPSSFNVCVRSMCFYIAIRADKVEKRFEAETEFLSRVSLCVCWSYHQNKLKPLIEIHLKRKMITIKFPGREYAIK